MLKNFFNRPADPFRDESEPSFLSIGDVLIAIGFTAAIIGGAHLAVEAVDHFRPETVSTEAPVSLGAVQSLPYSAQQTLG